MNFCSYKTAWANMMMHKRWKKIILKKTILIFVAILEGYYIACHITHKQTPTSPKDKSMVLLFVCLSCVTPFPFPLHTSSINERLFACFVAFCFNQRICLFYLNLIYTWCIVRRFKYLVSIIRVTTDVFVHLS